MRTFKQFVNESSRIDESQKFKNSAEVIDFCKSNSKLKKEIAKFPKINPNKVDYDELENIFDLIHTTSGFGRLDGNITNDVVEDGKDQDYDNIYDYIKGYFTFYIDNN